MSSIQELRIQGVRAFDEYDWQQIRFFTPLTLIAGPNGVGKTTIIECLRYAATGVLPPNSKGGAFVNDPHVSGKSEVKAQVKLSYITAQGLPATISRSMKVSVSRSGLTFKTLDSQCHISGAGSDGTPLAYNANARSNDLDMFVPQSMGVPASILNFVVFCHQEDSLWPLAEASIVKKRFDDIFENTKFTKALEHIKLLRKESSSEITLEAKTVEHLKEDAERSTVKESQVRELKIRVHEYESIISDLKSEIQVKTSRIAEIFRMGQQFQQAFYELKQLEDRESRLSESLTLLIADMQVLETPALELEIECKSLGDREAQLGHESEKVLEQVTAMESEVEAHREALAALANRKGRIDADVESKNIRSKTLMELCTTRGFSSFEELLESLRAEVARTSTEADNVALEHRRVEATIQMSISEADARALQLRQMITEKRKEFQDIGLQLVKAEKSVVVPIAVSVESLKLTIRDHEERLEVLKKDEQKYISDGTFSTAKARVDETELEVEAAQKELRKAASEQSYSAQYALLEESLKDKRSQMSDMDQKLRIDLLSLDAETDWNKNVQALFDEQRRAASLALQTVSEKSALTHSVRTDIRSELDSLNQQLSSLESQLERSGQDFCAAYEFCPNEYEIYLQKAEIELGVATQNMEHSTFTANFYKTARGVLTEQHKCLLCDHTKSDVESRDMLILLDKKLSALPVTPEQANSQYEAAKIRVDRLRRARKDIEAISQNRHSLESVAEASQLLQARLEANFKEGAELNEEVEAAQHVSSRYNAVAEQVLAWTHLQGEIDELEGRMKATKRNDPNDSSGRLQEAELQLSVATTTAKQARCDLESIRESHIGLESRIGALDRQISKLRVEVVEAELAEQQFKAQTTHVGELRDHKNQVAKLLEEAEAESLVIEKSSEDHRTKLLAKKGEAASLEARLSAIKNRAVAELQEVEEKLKLLQEFDEKYGSEPTREVDDRTRDHKAQMVAVQAKLAEFRMKARKLELMQADFGSHRRQVNDNLQAHRLRKEISELAVAIAALRTENAENTKEDYERETTALQNEVANLSSERSQKLGEVKQMQKQMLLLQEELDSSYRGVALDYARAKKHLEVKKEANRDLLEVEKGIDQTIMAFHKAKMKEINSVMDELWKKTYQGTDIDTIKIIAESSGSGARTAYNYRAVMVKQHTVLDMRGRCSAGQKVLACVVIRLALAECFGANCGLIVLDEPTTNLDHENAEALAHSLGHIITSRLAQRNFQLIVITHDEHFLAMMNPAQYCDQFYRVKRNENQWTEIIREPISYLLAS